MRYSPLALAILLSCATNPVTGKSELSLVSQSDEIAMGKQSAADVDATVGLYPDSNVQRYVSALGHSLAAHTERPDLPWQFHVVDDPAVNAFALPGGFIFVTRGLMAHVNNEAELATVVGHECGHVAAKHSVKIMSEAEVAQAALVIGMAVNKDVAKYGAAAQQGLQILFLKFSRDDESQADQLGFKYALADSFDVRQMAPMFVMLGGITKMSGSKLPEWQSTHPDPENRLAATNERLKSVTADLDKYKVERASYLRLIDGMVYGVNPRNGYFEGTHFIQPDLKFQFDFPAGWQTENQANAVLAAPKAGDAIMQIRIVTGSASQAAANFAATQGMQSTAPAAANVNGLTASTLVFAMPSQDQTQPGVQGRAVFLEYGGATYRMIGYSTTNSYAAYAPLFQQALATFAPLTDPKALAIQPMRVRLERTPRAMTLREFDKQFPSEIKLQELAVMNGIDSTAVISAGTMVKRVVR